MPEFLYSFFFHPLYYLRLSFLSPSYQAVVVTRIRGHKAAVGSPPSSPPRFLSCIFFIARRLRPFRFPRRLASKVVLLIVLVGSAVVIAMNSKQSIDAYHRGRGILSIV